MKDTMKYNLFLDDFRSVTDVFLYTLDHRYQMDWEIVRNYDQFVQCIEGMGIPHVVSFDHDLADIHYENQTNIDYSKYTEKTGYHCAKWLLHYCLDNKLNPPKIVLIHSQNVVGAENIKSLFYTFNKLYPDGIL